MTRPRVDALRAIAISRAIIAVAALIGTAALLVLALSVQSQREYNHCLSNLDSDWRRAVGLGLAAVAEEDDQALLEQTRVIRELSQEHC